MVEGERTTNRLIHQEVLELEDHRSATNLLVTLPSDATSTR